MVQVRQERVTASRLHRVQGLGPPDPKVVGQGGQGRQVGAPQGTGGEQAVGGDGHRGGTGVFEGHPCGVLAEGAGRRRERGRPRRRRAQDRRERRAAQGRPSFLCRSDLYGKLYGLSFPLSSGALRGEKENGLPSLALRSWGQESHV